MYHALSVKSSNTPSGAPNDVLSWYIKIAAVFLILIGLFAATGVQPIYGSLAPFYGSWSPTLGWPPGQLLFFLLVPLGLSALWLMYGHSDSDDPAPQVIGWALFGLILWAFVFSGAVAMLREGPAGISTAYSRSELEYIGDIGKVPSISALFARYVEIHPALSIHAQTHPPGPIALLWLMSYGIGQQPMALSLATMAFGSLSVLPMYLWAREVTGKAQTALLCTALFTLMPSIVLFTATSVDILFMPFTLTTLWLFTRALSRDSAGAAMGAGIGYGLMGLFSFTLLSVGAYFGFVALARLRETDGVKVVSRTAAIMVMFAVGVHLAVYLWSGYSSIEVFQIATSAHFRGFGGEIRPRYAWIWFVLFFNPMAWLWFAGVPVSVLAVWRVLRPGAMRVIWTCFALTWLALLLLYVGRGEGERAAMYAMPFLALPAGHLLAELAETAADARVVLVTAGFLLVQCWVTESFLRTPW